MNDSSEIHPMQVLGTPSIDLSQRKQIILDDNRAIYGVGAQKRSEIDGIYVLDDDDRLFLLQQTGNSDVIENLDDLFKLWTDPPFSKDM